MLNVGQPDTKVITAACTPNITMDNIQQQQWTTPTTPFRWPHTRGPNITLRLAQQNCGSHAQHNNEHRSTPERPLTRRPPLHMWRLSSVGQSLTALTQCPHRPHLPRCHCLPAARSLARSLRPHAHSPSTAVLAEQRARSTWPTQPAKRSPLPLQSVS